MTDPLDFLRQDIRHKVLMRRMVIIQDLLARYDIPPVSWYLSSPDEDGAVGSTDCPFSEMHSGHDDRSGLFRIWLDRKCPKTKQSKVFFSCRHTSCSQEVWNLNLTARLLEEDQRNVKLLKDISSIKSLREMDERQRHKLGVENKQIIENAKFGRETYHAIIKSAPRGLSLGSFREVSPIPVHRFNPYDQTLLHLSAFRPDQLIFCGDLMQSMNSKNIKPVSIWEALVGQHQSFVTDIQDEPESTWPHIGAFTTGSTYKRKTGGRCLENIDQTLYSVLEADSDPEDFSKPMSIRNQVALAMHFIEKTDRIVWVVFSGGKSLHIGVRGTFVPQDAVKFTGCFPAKVGVLPPMGAPKKWKYGGMGFDPMPLNTKCQPIRLAGHYRRDKGRRQSLLYFNPKAVHSITPSENTTLK